MWPGRTKGGGSRKNWKVSYRLHLKAQFISFKMMYDTSLISKGKLWYGAIKSMKTDTLKLKITEKTAIKVRSRTKNVPSTEGKDTWIDLSNGSVPLASTRQCSVPCAKIFTFYFTACIVNFSHCSAINCCSLVFSYLALFLTLNSA